MMGTTRRFWGRAVGAVIGAFLVTACSTSEADEAPTLSTTAVERGSLRITAEATGAVEPVLRLEVKSKASGEIQRLHVDVGDEVEVGTLLAEVDPRDVQNRYDQTEADLSVALAQRDNSQAQLTRSQNLHAAGVITDQERESSQLSFANAEASLIRARTNFELAELQVQDVTIRAPVAGTVLERSVEVGTVIQSASGNVSGGSVLFTMADLSEMQVRTLVDETDMGELRAGMSATVTVEAYPDRVFRGLVEKIEPQAINQSNVTMFPVIVRLDNRAGLLKPGMNSEVEILIDEATDILLIPNNAIVDLGDVGPAAMALGLDMDDIDLGAFRSTGRFGGALGGGGEAARALMAQVQSGEISQDSMRALMGARGGGAAGGVAGAREGRGGGAEGRAGGRQGRAGRGDTAPGVERQTRRAAVFVMADSASAPSPVVIEIGLNDWDRTQIVSGLEEGALIAIVGAAQLQAQQAAFLEQMRGFGGGGSPFGGGGGRPGRGR